MYVDAVWNLISLRWLFLRFAHAWASGRWALCVGRVMRNERKEVSPKFYALPYMYTLPSVCVSEFDEPKDSHDVHIPDYDIPTEIPRKHKQKNREPEAWVPVRM